MGLFLLFTLVATGDTDSEFYVSDSCPEYSSDEWKPDSDDDEIGLVRKGTFLRKLREKERMIGKKLCPRDNSSDSSSDESTAPVSETCTTKLLSTKLPKTRRDTASPVIPFIPDLEETVEYSLNDYYAVSNSDLDSTSSDSEKKNDQQNKTSSSDNLFRSRKIMKQSSSSSFKELHHVDKPVLYEVAVNTKAEKQSKHSKLQYCKFCLLAQLKLSRHLIRHHEDEEDVREMLRYDPKDSRRQTILTKIRNDGNYIHNRSVVARGVGELHTKRRLNKNATTPEKRSETYLPCPNCRTMLKENYLYRHRNKCVVKQPELPTSSETNHSSTKRLRAEAALLLPSHYKVSKLFSKHVLSRMANDDLFRVIRSDKLILKMGERMYQKLGSCDNQANYISVKMREMGKFLSAMREVENNPHKTLGSCIKGREIKNIINAVRKVAQYDEETMLYGIPSLALKIGHGLNKCCTILIGEAAENDNEREKLQLKSFQDVMESNWSVEISSNALKTMKNNKMNKVATLPLVEDIRKFNVFCQNQIRESLEKIADIPLSDDLLVLARSVLALLVVFNRRRAGEVQRTTINQAKNLKTGNVHPDIREHLNNFESVLAEKLARFEIVGKRGRTVPVLLTPLL